MRGGWNDVEQHARRNQYCCDEIFKGKSGELSGKKALVYIEIYKQSSTESWVKKVGSKGHCDEVADRN